MLQKGKGKKNYLFLLSRSRLQFLGSKSRFELEHPGPFGCPLAQERPNLQVFVLLWRKSPLILCSVFQLHPYSENRQLTIKIFPLFIPSCFTPGLMLNVIQWWTQIGYHIFNFSPRGLIRQPLPLSRRRRENSRRVGRRTAFSCLKIDIFLCIQMCLLCR